MKRSGEAALLVLEAALVLPFVLLLLATLLAQIRATQMEILIASALDTTAEEIAVVIPLADAALSGVLDSGMQGVLRELLPAGQAGELVLDLALDLGSSLVFGALIQARHAFWLDDAVTSTGFELPPFGRQLFLDWRNETSQLFLTLHYDLVTPFFTARREVRALIPLWTEGVPFADELPEEERQEQNDPIWELSNFERGARFRELYGANLPFSFPVVAAWSEGQVVSIKSVDLTAPSYERDFLARQHLEQLILQLGLFQGASLGTTTITPLDIQSRVLRLVVPENTPAYFTPDFVQELEQYAGMHGVVLELHRHGQSGRYQNQE